MRNTFIKELVKEARINNRIVLLIGDLGYSVVEEFQKEFPDRFFNAGIAEQSMASIAAGLSAEGFHVFIYSIANFPTFRCAEQLRNDIGYHNLNVTIVSVGGGVAYGNLGYSHHAIQDLGLIRLFPEFTIYAPGDPNELQSCFKHIISEPGPSYLRIKKNGEINYSQKDLILMPGIWNRVTTKNSDKIILTTGGGLQIVKQHIANYPEFSDYDIFTCPIWGARFKSVQQSQIDKFNIILTVEDHLFDCGFGSWLREAIVNPEAHMKLSNMALSQNVIGKVGSEEYLLKEGKLIK
jgi:transketolase